jgi:hypothetical protein
MRFMVSGLGILPNVRTGRTNDGTLKNFFFDIRLNEGDDGKRLCCTHVPDGFNVIGVSMTGGVITVLCQTPAHIVSESALFAREGCISFEFR